MSTLEIKESTISPTGTQACFIKESPARLRIFLDQSSPHEPEVELTLLNSELSSRIQFGLLHDPRLRIVRSIPVDIHRDGDTWVASWDEAEEFGYGESRSEALEDFARTVAQLFITLNREKESLGPALVRTLSLLNEHLQFRG